MNHEWKPEPGDVALVSEIGQHERVGIRDTHGWAIVNEWGDHSHSRWIASDLAVVARPLVVFDPEDRDDCEDLADALTGVGIRNAGWDLVRAALLELAGPTPPKPDEPTAYLSAVVDVHGNRWHISGGPTDGDRRWYSPDLNVTRAYSDIAAVRILSTGVSDGDQ